MTTTSLLVAVCFLTCLPIVAAVIWTGRQAIFPKHLPVNLDWLEELSPERYAPISRLLSAEDLEFLRSQPGFTRKMERRFRRDRCQIFRGYLSELGTDFQQVCTALKLVMVQANEDRPDLAATLISQQLSFKVGMLTVLFHLFLYRYGIGTVEVSGLLKVFDAMRLELRSLVPATEASW